MGDGEFVAMEMDINQTELYDVNYTGRVIISIYFLLVATFGFLGNLIILIVLFKIPNKMRTHTNIFFGSLAVSDLMTCLNIPFIAAGILSKTGWPMPNWVCIINAIVRFTSQGSSVWNLVAIAVNRLVLVTMSARLYRVLYQTSTIIVNIAFVWLFPFSCVIIPYLTGAIDIGFDKGPNICSDTDHDRDGNPTLTFVYIQGIVLSCIPLAIVVVCYIRIYVFVRLHVRRQKAATPRALSKDERRPTKLGPNSSTSETESGTNGGKATKQPNKRQIGTRFEKKTFRRTYSQLESRITKNCLYVFFGFLICIIPYGILILANTGFKGAPLAMVFLVFNTCLNPIIYGTKHPLLKAAMWNILTARFRRDSNIPGASALRSGTPSGTRQNMRIEHPPIPGSLGNDGTFDNSQDLV